MSHRTLIFCEDKYGEPFLRALTNKLKSIGVIPSSIGFDAVKFYGACNSKLEAQLLLKSGASIRNFVILVDSDGHDKTLLLQRVKQHVPKALAEFAHIIVFDYEIEDWLCSGLGIMCNGRTARILQKQFGYEKYQLPSYVSKLDIDKLKTCPSFQEFLASV